MGFRTLVIKNRAKIETRLGYLLVRGEEEKWYNIGEIDTLIVESTACAVTAQALLELSNSKTNIVFCDKKHLPYGQLTLFNANANTSGNIKTQMNWDRADKEYLWQNIVYQKIYWQMMVLKKYGETETAELLSKYLSEIEPNDVTNREGHSAKVYFNALFGQDFSRRSGGFINGALNYAYAVLMSEIARHITAYGYINSIGIWHNNQFNAYNLACDFMEIFRPLADDFVISNCKEETTFKTEASKLLLMKVKIKGQEFYLDSACDIFVRNCFRFLRCETEEILQLEGYEV
jgi:CRISPR-associated endonuclease Cas1 subtype II